MTHFARAIIFGTALPFLISIMAIFILDGEKLQRIMYLAAAYAWGGFCSVLYFSLQIGKKSSGWIDLTLWIVSLIVGSVGFAYLAPGFEIKGSFGSNFFSGLMLVLMGAVLSVWGLAKLKDLLLTIFLVISRKSMGSVVGGIIVIILGLWLRSKAGSFTGDWPLALSMGCFIVGIVSIISGAKNVKKQLQSVKKNED